MAGLYREEQLGGGQCSFWAGEVQGRGWGVQARRTLKQVGMEGCEESVTVRVCLAPMCSPASKMFVPGF